MLLYDEHKIHIIVFIYYYYYYLKIKLWEVEEEGVATDSGAKACSFNEQKKTKSTLYAHAMH